MVYDYGKHSKCVDYSTTDDNGFGSRVARGEYMRRMNYISSVGTQTCYYTLLRAADGVVLDGSYPSVLPEPAYLHFVISRPVRAPGFIVIATIA